MQWEEDVWEDVIEPTSALPRPGETSIHNLSKTSYQRPVRDTEHDSSRNHGLAALEETRKDWHHPADVPETSRLRGEIQQEAADDTEPDLDDVNKIAQELLQSFQSLRESLVHFVEQESDVNCPETLTNARQGEHQTHFNTLSTKTKSFEAKKKQRGNQTNRLKDPGVKAGIKGPRDKAIPPREQTKFGVRISQVNNTKVPHSLCKSTSSSPQVTALRKGSTQQTSRYRFESSRGRTLPLRDYQLQEYQKLPKQDRYPTLKNNGTEIRTAYADLYIDEEEERAKVIVCVVSCIMGLGLIISIVCLISRYDHQTDGEPIGVPVGDLNHTDLMNKLYYRRVADVIKTAHQSDETLLRSLRHRNTAAIGSVILPPCETLPLYLLFYFCI